MKGVVMKKMLVVLLVLLPLPTLGSNDLDKTLIKGCQDVLVGNYSAERTYIEGYVTGVKDLGVNVMIDLGFPPVVGVKLEPICRQALHIWREKASEIKAQGGNFLAILNIVTRGFLIEVNGYTYPQVRERVKKVKRFLGTLNEKKKKKKKY